MANFFSSCKVSGFLSLFLLCGMAEAKNSPIKEEAASYTPVRHKKTPDRQASQFSPDEHAYFPLSNIPSVPDDLKSLTTWEAIQKNLAKQGEIIGTKAQDSRLDPEILKKAHIWRQHTLKGQEKRHISPLKSDVKALIEQARKGRI